MSTSRPYASSFPISQMSNKISDRNLGTLTLRNRNSLAGQVRSQQRPMSSCMPLITDPSGDGGESCIHP
ncbi:hypothetical protein BDR05DRAFT_681269 [Suillus weaverae]|nr:hypothetical protein BDR05DRAFT_681269 [Suillus weaverae]